MIFDPIQNRRPDLVPDLNKISAKFLLEISLAEICSKAVLRIQTILMRIRIRPLKKTGCGSHHAPYKILKQDIFA
jgi:hypothetical protein